jgi:hypothetical protein
MTVSQCQSEEGEMARVINCECGQTIRGADDDELVARAQRHVDENHPELAGKLGRSEFLAMAEEE